MAKKNKPIGRHTKDPLKAPPKVDPIAYSGKAAKFAEGGRVSKKDDDMEPGYVQRKIANQVKIKETAAARKEHLQNAYDDTRPDSAWSDTPDADRETEKAIEADEANKKAKRTYGPGFKKGGRVKK